MVPRFKAITHNPSVVYMVGGVYIHVRETHERCAACPRKYPQIMHSLHGLWQHGLWVAGWVYLQLYLEVMWRVVPSVAVGLVSVAMVVAVMWGHLEDQRGDMESELW